jgi:hypothetical protein
MAPSPRGERQYLLLEREEQEFLKKKDKNMQ